MRLELIIKPEAEAEIEDSFDWYELQAEGLGYDFVHNVEQTLEAIEVMPFGYQIVHRELRRAIVHRFPHSILYLEGPTIYVVACVHRNEIPKFG